LGSKIGCKDHNGKEFFSIAEMCRYHGVSPALYSRRISKGYTKEQALLGKNPDRRSDHNGRRFDTVEAMCDFYNISVTTYNTRLRAGYTKEQALTDKNSHNCSDHNGKEFDSIKAMCDFYDVSVNTYHAKIQAGYTKEQALSCKRQRNYGNFEGSGYIDHLGNRFETKKEMCTFHDISVYVYNSRLQRGYTKEQALSCKCLRNCIYFKDDEFETKKSLRSRKVFGYVDHLGNKFDTKKEMCTFHGVSFETYRRKIHEGCTMEEALSCKRQYNRNYDNFNGSGYTDHLGNEFETKKEMCMYHGVPFETYRDRIHRGCTVEQALTGKELYEDHNGNEFRSVREMCEYHGVERSTYISRLRKGYTKEQALTGKGVLKPGYWRNK